MSFDAIYKDHTVISRLPQTILQPVHSNMAAIRRAIVCGTEKCRKLPMNQTWTMNNEFSVSDRWGQKEQNISYIFFVYFLPTYRQLAFVAVAEAVAVVGYQAGSTRATRMPQM